MTRSFKSGSLIFNNRHIGNQGDFLINIFKEQPDDNSQKIMTVYGVTEEECKVKTAFLLTVLNDTIPELHPF